MKSDVIEVSSREDRTETVLEMTKHVADYSGLSHKDSIYLRLLAEEMMGMMRAITGDVNGEFWIESGRDRVFELHLLVSTKMDPQKREQLLRASTTGRNEANRGFMGKIRAFFDPLEDMSLLYDMTPDGLQMPVSWSMRAYRQQVRTSVEQNRKGAAEAWDELERSVVAHVADEVKVRIDGYEVEMTAIRQF
ncbi:MAG: hypothetical protein II640_08815 [Lachnospiraceae bacterium]|nr:hypothetical protein [Lachnospiraceae bacterium]